MKQSEQRSEEEPSPHDITEAPEPAVPAARAAPGLLIYTNQ